MKAGWRVVPLGDVCTVIAGQSPDGSAYNDRRDGLPFYQGKREFTDRYLGPATTWTTQVTKIAEADDILMSVRAPVGPINLAAERICIGRGLAAIRPKTGLDVGFLWYALLWMQPKITGSEGAVFASINRDQICALSIPLPPLDEQKRIVAVLDEAFEGLSRARANAKANLADAHRLWASSLATTFSALADRAQLVELSTVVTDDCTLSYGIVQPGDETDAGLPIVRPVDLTGDTVGLAGLKRINPTHAQGYKRTELQGGELLLCVRGTTGTVSIADVELSGANVTRGIVPIRFRSDRINPRFAFFQFIAPNVQDQIRARTYGAALMQINIGDLRKLTLLLPSQEEQAAACQKLEGIRANHAELATLQTQQIEAIDILRQSLLQKAFSGELT